MKRTAATVIFFSALVAFGGCSSLSADGACAYDSDCGDGYRCDAYLGACFVPGGGTESCAAPTDCSPSYTCGKEGRCLLGDCSFNGCVAGFECQSSTGRWECAPSSGGASGNEDTPQADPSSAGAAGQAG